MRKKMVIGNWKMHGNLHNISELLQEILTNFPQQSQCECVVLPPSIYVAHTQKLLQNSRIDYGVQNIYPQDEGAYTGEISGIMAKEFGCKYVLIGHSERRNLFGENDNLIAQKFNYTKNHHMTPILCIGETLKERESGLTEEVLSKQLSAIFKQSAALEDYIANSIIAYEPVWAIGTGKTATPQQIQETHHYIRNYIANHYAVNSNSLTILYGGSVNERNAQEIFAIDNVDGGLIGGAALDSNKFLQIIAAF